jgi:tRNA threonylcarbamoyladenosine biosynthesis protein TsaB
MGFILNIETSTPICSVALTDEDRVIESISDVSGNSHAKVLSVLSEKLLKENNLSFSDLSAIAVSKGPGSYTGLRIGTSFAKGLCYSLDIPLISVSTLKSIAKGLNTERRVENCYICPMIDARRMEVYSQVFNNDCIEINEISAKIIDKESFSELLKEKTIYFLGTGAEKCKELINSPNAIFVDDFVMNATNMTDISIEKFKNNNFENTAYFEPFYLKEFVAIKPKNKVLS